MYITSWIYRKLIRKEPPKWMAKFNLFKLLWKTFRKGLCVSIIPFCPINCIRVLGYRIVGFKIGKDVFIGMQCYFDDVEPSQTIIEDKVVVSYRVTFACHGPRMKNKRCVLHEGCYIGTNATILGGIEIGPYATVGACTMVNKDVPSFSTVAGIPAEVIATDTVPWDSCIPKLEELKKKFSS